MPIPGVNERPNLDRRQFGPRFKPIAYNGSMRLRRRCKIGKGNDKSIKLVPDRSTIGQSRVLDTVSDERIANTLGVGFGNALAQHGGHGESQFLKLPEMELLTLATIMLFSHECVAPNFQFIGLCRDDLINCLPATFEAATSRVAVDSHSATYPERSIRQSAKSALAHATKTRSAFRLVSAHSTTSS